MDGKTRFLLSGRGHAETCAAESQADLQGGFPEPGKRVRAVRAERRAGGALRLRRGGGDPVRQPGRRPRGPVGGEAQVRIRRREADLHPTPRGGSNRRGGEGGSEQDRGHYGSPGKRDAVPAAAGPRRGRQARQGVTGPSYRRFFRIRSTASATFSRLPNA